MTFIKLPEDIEKRFDELFVSSMQSDYDKETIKIEHPVIYRRTRAEDVKQFIASELATAKAEGVKEGEQAERKRIKKWLNDNQLLETKELGKIVLWGWIYQVVSHPEGTP